MLAPAAAGPDDDRSGSATSAARAGADLLLFSGEDIEEGVGGYRELCQTFQGGSMNERAFRAGAARVLRLRKALEKVSG